MDSEIRDLCNELREWGWNYQMIEWLLINPQKPRGAYWRFTVERHGASGVELSEYDKVQAKRSTLLGAIRAVYKHCSCPISATI